ncbi:MAG: hypothetical protein LBM64_02625 [Deltaproteobacteria bacterium]|nr:hypothetical protein [Deltaproteobacteria bacterium]
MQSLIQVDPIRYPFRRIVLLFGKKGFFTGEQMTIIRADTGDELAEFAVAGQQIFFARRQADPKLAATVQINKVFFAREPEAAAGSGRREDSFFKQGQQVEKGRADADGEFFIGGEENIVTYGPVIELLSKSVILQIFRPDRLAPVWRIKAQPPAEGCDFKYLHATLKICFIVRLAQRIITHMASYSLRLRKLPLGAMPKERQKAALAEVCQDCFRNSNIRNSPSLPENENPNSETASDKTI